MLQEGLALVGAALLLHANARAKASKSRTEEDPDSDPEPSPPAFKMPEPTLDSALYAADPTNPLLIGPGSSSGNPLPPNAMPGLGGNPGTDYLTGGNITVSQLAAANRAYKYIVGSIPSAIKQKIENVKRLTSFQARVRRKLKFW